MKILLANANTTETVTAKIVSEARLAAAPESEVVGATGRFGAAIIATRAEMAIAEHAMLELLACHATDVDAVVIGVSFDVGLRAAREVLSVPVIGMTEAACLTACTLGGRFGLVTYGRRNATVFHEIVAGYGLGSRLVGIRALDASPENMLADPEALHAAIADVTADLVETAGAEVVILAGAVMAGLPAILQPHVPVPLLEGISCAIGMAKMLVRLRPARPRVGSFARPGHRAVAGVGVELARLLGK
jgi:allantoin racemase